MWVSLSSYQWKDNKKPLMLRQSHFLSAGCDIILESVQLLPTER